MFMAQSQHIGQLARRPPDPSHMYSRPALYITCSAPRSSGRSRLAPGGSTGRAMPGAGAGAALAGLLCLLVRLDLDWGWSVLPALLLPPTAPAPMHWAMPWRAFPFSASCEEFSYKAPRTAAAAGPTSRLWAAAAAAAAAAAGRGRGRGRARRAAAPAPAYSERSRHRHQVLHLHLLQCLQQQQAKSAQASRSRSKRKRSSGVTCYCTR